MADRFEQAKALVADARSKLAEVKKQYDCSLQETHIRVQLQIAIKGVFDSLRSALDYVARELYAKHGTVGRADRVYFPIAAKGAKQTDFKSLVGKNIPGLPAARPDLLLLLESYQEFTSPVSNAWMPVFAALTNENKHEHLTPQTRKETRELQIQCDHAVMSIGQGAIISIARGGSIQIGDLTIEGGQSFGPGHPPIVGGQGSVHDIIWVSFEFAATGTPVIPLLEQAVGGIDTIVRQMESHV